MAHKKSGGSSRNGRDSESKRLGVKKFGGERVLPRRWPPSNAKPGQYFPGSRCSRQQPIRTKGKFSAGSLDHQAPRLRFPASQAARALQGGGAEDIETEPCA
jgi:hypothetical protein